jgi:uncharacterized membrane protein (UPF0127 family)
MKKKHFGCLALLLVAFAVFSSLGCGRTPTVSFNNGHAVSALKVEVADSARERDRGLMGRKNISSDGGMLFDFGHEVETAFWMKNTSIPLSIAFISQDGKVLAIKDLVPYDPTAVGPPGEYRYAVEANRGWFAAHGIRAGNRATVDM